MNLVELVVHTYRVNLLIVPGWKELEAIPDGIGTLSGSAWLCQRGIACLGVEPHDAYCIVHELAHHLTGEFDDDRRAVFPKQRELAHLLDPEYRDRVLQLQAPDAVEGPKSYSDLRAVDFQLFQKLIGSA